VSTHTPNTQSVQSEQSAQSGRGPARASQLANDIDWWASDPQPPDRAEAMARADARIAERAARKGRGRR
jgi:hypothetical protein